MSSFRLAVDYGTSTTVAFLRWPDGRVRPLLFDDSPLLPSAVYLEPDGRLLTGRDAVRSARFEPGRFEANPKRRVDDQAVLLGDRVIPVEDLIAATLSRVLEEATRIASARPAGVTLTHPATWGELRRNALVRAAERAGLPPVELVPEPVAAATAFATVLGHAVPPGSSVVVYDLGAGTFDVSVVRREPGGFRALATDGLADIGGLDLDAVIVDLVRRGSRPEHEELWHRLDNPSDAAEQRAARELWDGAREAKEALSRRASVPVPVPGLAEPQHVTREELEAAARPVLAQTVAVTTATLRGVAPIAGLFLVGGSTRVPVVASLLHRATGIAPTVIEQPELVVAEGALHATGTSAPVPTMTVVDPPPAVVVEPGPPARKRRLGATLAIAGAAAVALAVVLAVFQWPEGRRDASGDTPGLTGAGAGVHASSVNASPAGAGPGPVTSSTAPPTAGPKNSPTRRTTTTPTARPTGPITVTAALVKTRLSYNGACPPPGNTPIQLTVDFTTNGPTQVEYYWKSDPGWDTEVTKRTTSVPKAGTTRAPGGFYGGWSNTPGETISYWVQLVVTKPISYTSEKVTWSTTCTTVA
jgi:actin-like ATPase involved in cell morphogenesis